MKFIQDFKEFAIKGNMIDMAIGVIVGTAFKDVINVIVKKVMMPFLSLFTDGINLSDKKIIIKEKQLDGNGAILSEEVFIGYGELINVFIDFFIIALVTFLMVKSLHAFKKKAEDPKDAEVKTPQNIQLMDDMKELLIEQNNLIKDFMEQKKS